MERNRSNRSKGNDDVTYSRKSTLKVPQNNNENLNQLSIMSVNSQFENVLKQFVAEKQRKRFNRHLASEHRKIDQVKNVTWLEKEKEKWSNRFKEHFTWNNTFPFLKDIKKYSPKSFLKDFIVALTLCFVLITQGIAMSLATGVDIYIGIYGVIVPCIIYPFIGDVRNLILAPEVSPSVIFAMAISSIQQTDSSISSNDIVIAVSFVGAIMYGLIFITRQGFISHVTSGSLLVGFMSAIGFYIMVGSIGPLLGLKQTSYKYSVVQKFVKIGESSSKISIPTVILSVISLIILFGHKIIHHFYPKNQIIRHIPATLIIIICSIICSYALNFKDIGISTIGNFAIEVPSITLPYIPTNVWDKVITSAILLTIVGYTETTIVAKELAHEEEKNFKPNREAGVLALINMLTSLYSGMGVIGSHTLSIISHEADPSSNLALLLAGILVIIFYAVFPIVISLIPSSTVAAILFMTGFNLIKWNSIIYIFKKTDLNEIFLFLVPFLTTIFVNLEVGLLISLLLAMIILAKYATKPQMCLLGRDPVTKRYVNIEDHYDCEILPGVLIIQINSNLLFFNSEKMRNQIEKLERNLEFALQQVSRSVKESKGSYVTIHKDSDSDSIIELEEHSDEDDSTNKRSKSPMRIMMNLPSALDPNEFEEFNDILLIEDIVFDLSGCRKIDSSAALVLLNLVKQFTKSDKHKKRVWFTNVNDVHRQVLYATGIVRNKMVGESHIITKLEDCMNVILDFHKPNNEHSSIITDLDQPEIVVTNFS